MLIPLNKKISVFLFAILILFLYSTNCYEDKESLLKRYKLSKKISKFSNNTIKLTVSQSNGISCQANDYIQNLQKLITIPKNLTLCAYYLFPFKYEIISYLFEIPMLKESLNSDQKLSVYLLSYYLLYYMYADKEKIRNYLNEKKLMHYKNFDEIDESLKDYFPKQIPGSVLLHDENILLLNSIGYPIIDELKLVFNSINLKIQNSEHKEYLMPWTSNLDHFKWAFSMVMSRSFTIKLEKYLLLEGVDLKNPNNPKNAKFFKSNPIFKKNYEVNKNIAPTGTGCLIPFVDLLNHYQPQFTNLKDQRDIIIEVEEGNYVYHASHDYSPGQELLHTYNHDPTNYVLFTHYGFVISYNIFNFYTTKIKDNTFLSDSQIKLCRELKCLDPKLSLENQKQNPIERHYQIRVDQINESLINYARVVHLELGNFHENSSYLKMFINNGKFSSENEVKAWVYYFKSIFKLDTKISDLLGKSIKECQKTRNKLRNIEKYWLEKNLFIKHNLNSIGENVYIDTKTTESNRLKNYENIYLVDISYRKIVIKHLLGSINQGILNIHSDLENIKKQYFI